MRRTTSTLRQTVNCEMNRNKFGSYSSVIIIIMRAVRESGAQCRTALRGAGSDVNAALNAPTDNACCTWSYYRVAFIIRQHYCHQPTLFSLKLKFHGEVSLYYACDVLARMSLACHEEIWRVGRVGRGCYEYALLFRYKSCVSGSWNMENNTTHAQTDNTIMLSHLDEG